MENKVQDIIIEALNDADYNIETMVWLSCVMTERTATVLNTIMYSMTEAPLRGAYVL